MLHGSSGVQDRDLKEGIRSGMSKINIATHLNQLLTNQIRAILKEDPSLNDPRRYVGKGRDAISEEVARLLLLLGG